MNKLTDLTQIKEIIKYDNPDFYDKIIVSEGLKRNDYSIVSYSYKTINRKLHTTKIPFCTELQASFNNISSEVPSFQNKALLIDRLLNEKYMSSYSSVLESYKNNEELEFLIQSENNEILETQDRFFIIDSLKKYPCHTCEGDGLVSCDSDPCNGKHQWECDKCLGDGKTSCDDCDGEGENTCGGWFSGCGGSGKVKTEVKLTSGKTREELIKCSKCAGKGQIKCVTCKSKGQVTCSKCDGKKHLTCSNCYSDRRRYGLIDCSSCDAQGKFIEFDYVNSNIETKNVRRIIPKGDRLLLNESELIKFYSHLENELEVFKQINEVVTNDYDNITEEYCNFFQSEFNLKKDSFPKLLQENISHKNVICIEFSYTHIISNEVHKGVILNPAQSPEVLFYTNPEEIKTNLKSLSKSTFTIFSKLLKTKKSKQKNDRFIEIKLMIYLAKADGVIEEEEKQYISSSIQDLDDFTNSEKSVLFDLMNMNVLPELTKKDLKFSNKETALETVNKLEELAMIDGEREVSEIEFINNLKSNII